MNVVSLAVLPLAPLLAIDIESLLPFLFVIYWIVSQIFGALRRGQQAPGPKPRQPRVDPVAGPRPPANADDPQADIARQIEEFLRQASGEPPRRADGGAAPRPAEAARPRAPARPPALPPQAAGPAAAPRRPSTLSPRERDEALRSREGQPETRRVDARPPRDRIDPAPAPAAARKGAPKPRASQPPVSSSARSPAPTLTRLDGGDGNTASVERHVSEAFGRELPHLAAGQGRAAAQPAPESTPARPSLADDLVRKLRDPASMRELVLLREVLDRPVHRW